MKALFINGSPNAKGCTFTALNIAAEKERNGLPEAEEAVFTDFIR
ncbi:MAG: hypothetical protein SPL42_02840 [Bacteroidales bacterium]|nr:hypothetical protein [Bacteroidales bacterium]